MYVVKFVLTPVEFKEAVIAKYAKKFGISAFGYPLTYYKEDGKFFFTATGFVFGSNERVNAAMKEMGKDPKIIHLEYSRDLITLEYEGDVYVKELYDPHFIKINPIKTNPDGSELWEIGCWQREKLMKLVSALKKKYNVKILNISEKKVGYLSIIQVIPKLTEKQKKALLIAINEGYYEMPRKIELEQLAKIMKISFSTYRQHLRTAEAKFFKRIKDAI